MATHKKNRITGGSSPLTRGKLVALTLAGVLIRLIPAHAGKTIDTGNSLASPKAHPRSRGENPATAHDAF